MSQTGFLFHKKWQNIAALIVVVLLTFIDKIIPPLGIPIAVVCIFLLFWWRKIPVGQLGLFQPKSRLKTVLLGLIVGTSITALGFCILTPVTEWLGIGQQGSSDFYESIEGNTSRLILFLVVSWTTAGFGEELVYRSFFLGQFVSVVENVKYKWTFSLVISSVLFGLLHFNNGVYAIIVTGINGFILGWVYLKTDRNIWAAYISHAVANTVELIAVYSGVYKFFL